MQFICILFCTYTELNYLKESEAEWVGLSLNEACMKLQDMEEAAKKSIPLKFRFEQEYLEELQNSSTKSQISSWFKRALPFGNGKSKS